MRTAQIALAAIAVVACLVSCGTDSAETPATPSTAAASTTSAPTTTPSSIVPPPPVVAPSEPAQAESTYVEEPYTEPAMAEPVIVDCQTGLGPITTYWSDGSVTGYSDYCQSVHDQVLQGERDANTSVCDGVVCTYPNGATIPDPNAVPDDRCTNQIDYATDPRSNAEINSIGESTGQCPAPIG